MPPQVRSKSVLSTTLGVGLMCTITLWVTIFYVIEANRLSNNKFASDYRIYYSVISENEDL